MKRFQSYGKWLGIVLVVLLLAIYLWPFSLLDKLPFSDDDISVVCVELSAQPSSTITSYLFAPDSPEAEKLMDILGGYSAHRTWRTLVSDASTEGNDTGWFLHVYSGTETYFSCGGSGEIILGDHVYRTDYVGHSHGLALMEEIEAFLAGCTPVSVTTD